MAKMAEILRRDLALLQELASVDMGDIPSQAIRLVQKYGIELPDHYVLMNQHPHLGGNLIYSPEDRLPMIAVLGWDRKSPKVYDLDAPCRPGQDASDLPLYEEIVIAAHNRIGRDVETCKLVAGIQARLVAVLLSYIVQSWQTYDVSEEELRGMRGRVERAKFAAVTIWREGRQYDREVDSGREYSHGEPEV